MYIQSKIIHFFFLGSWGLMEEVGLHKGFEGTEGSKPSSDTDMLCGLGKFFCEV